MKYLPCIPDEILPAEFRQRIYNCEINSEQIVASGRVVALVDPQEVAENYLELLAVVDRLAAAWLDVARERDQWKGVVDLAVDKNFWKSLEILGASADGQETERSSEKPSTEKRGA